MNKSKFLIWCAAALLVSSGISACDADNGESAAESINAAAEKEPDRPADQKNRDLQLEITPGEVMVIEKNKDGQNQPASVKVIKTAPEIKVRSLKK